MSSEIKIPNAQRLAEFRKVYVGHLSVAFVKSQLRFSPEETAERMTDALAAGTANKDSPAIRATCKQLGIKFTYSAIRDYLCLEVVTNDGNSQTV